MGKDYSYRGLIVWQRAQTLALGAHRNHLSIARGSTAETDSWLDLLRRRGSISAEEEAQLHADCGEIMAILTSKKRDLDRLANEAGRIREQPMAYAAFHLDEPLFPFCDDDCAEQA